MPQGVAGGGGSVADGGAIQKGCGTAEDRRRAGRRSDKPPDCQESPAEPSALLRARFTGFLEGSGGIAEPAAGLLERSGRLADKSGRAADRYLRPGGAVRNARGTFRGSPGPGQRAPDRSAGFLDLSAALPGRSAGLPDLSGSFLDLSAVLLDRSGTFQEPSGAEEPPTATHPPTAPARPSWGLIRRPYGRTGLFYLDSVLERSQSCEHLLVVAVDADLLPDLADLAFAVDQEGGALDAHGGLPVHVLLRQAP